MACTICRIRKPRRFCPGVGGDICSICCGTEREVTVDCPFDCPYLQEARKHEHPGEIDPDSVPNQDIRVSEEFVQSHEALLVAACRGLVRGAAGTSGAIDQDVRDALDALVRTRRTLQSGIYYETRPGSSPAKRIYEALETDLEEFRNRERERLGMSRISDADVLAMLVFLQRLELARANGRPRGRAFLDFVRSFLGAQEAATAPPAPTLIVP